MLELFRVPCTVIAVCVAALIVHAYINRGD